MIYFNITNFLKKAKKDEKGNRVIGNKQNNILLWYTGNVIEENYVTDSENGINFEDTGGGLYANNKARGTTTNYANVAGFIDGGGNFGF